MPFEFNRPLFRAAAAVRRPAVDASGPSLYCVGITTRVLGGPLPLSCPGAATVQIVHSTAEFHVLGGEAEPLSTHTNKFESKMRCIRQPGHGLRGCFSGAARGRWAALLHRCYASYARVLVRVWVDLTIRGGVIMIAVLCGS